MNNIPLVDLKTQYNVVKNDIDTAISRVIAHTSFIGGQEVVNFEQAFALYQRTQRCVGVSSGTSALFLTLKSLGIKPGDEIITSPHTFIATAEVVENLGAKIVFADIDQQTFNIDPGCIERAITPATRAIIPVHLYGQMAQMDRIIEISKKYGLWVVEDAAQAHGAEYLGKRAGEWGHAACFSFFPSKNLGAYGDAGAVCTNDDILADKIAILRDHGRKTKYSHEIIGYGERLDAIQAAILNAKLPYLDEWNRARRQHANKYKELLNNTSIVTTPFELSNAYHVYHIYCVRTRKNRDALLKKLIERGIGVGIHYPIPLHLQPAFKHYRYQLGDYPNSETVANEIISLPMFPEITAFQLERVVFELKQCIEEVA